MGDDGRNDIIVFPLNVAFEVEEIFKKEKYYILKYLLLLLFSHLVTINTVYNTLQASILKCTREMTLHPK